MIRLESTLKNRLHLQYVAEKIYYIALPLTGPSITVEQFAVIETFFGTKAAEADLK